MFHVGSMLGETGKPVFRKGIRTIIGSQQDILLVAQAAAATDAMREFRFDRPDVALLDPSARPAQHAGDGALCPPGVKMLRWISVSRIWLPNCTAIRRKMLQV